MNDHNGSVFSRLKSNPLFLVATILLIGIIAAYSVSLVRTKLRTGQDKTVGDAIAYIGKTVELPNETPDTAIVNDASALADQPFFKDAQNGDVAILYKVTGKALLYRPSTKKIINFSNINTAGSTAEEAGEFSLPPESPTVTPAPTPVPTPPVSIAIYNATGQEGVAPEVQTTLAAQYQQTSIITNEILPTQPGIQVYANSLEYASDAVSIARLLNGVVITSPPNIQNPPTDAVVVIVGTDYLDQDQPVPSN